MSSIGIDIAKLTFVGAVKVGDDTTTHEFNNTTEGFADFHQWVATFGLTNTHYCMESTGKYGFALAEYLFTQNEKVSMVNPYKIKHFAKSLLLRNKTDKLDAGLIAHYCQVMQPTLWSPKPAKIQRLRALLKRMSQLESMMRQDKNRLELENDLDIIKSINMMLEHFKTEINTIENLIAELIANDVNLANKASLLKTIKGVGNKTLYLVLSHFGDPDQFESPKQFAAYMGINPAHNQSGTSLDQSSLSKVGDPYIRKMLYMPTLSATQCNPLIKAFYQRLVNNGKPKKLAVCAAMRKLIFIIFGVLKNQTEFDPNYVNTLNCG